MVLSSLDIHALCFANDRSIFGRFFQSLYSLVGECQTCNRNVAGLIPSSVTNSLLVYNLLYCFKATIGSIFLRFLAVANFANINSNE